MNLFLDRLMVCKVVLEENILLVMLIKLVLFMVMEMVEVNGEKKLVVSFFVVSWVLCIVNFLIGFGMVEIFVMVKFVRLVEFVEVMIFLLIFR